MIPMANPPSTNPIKMDIEYFHQNKSESNWFHEIGFW